MAISSDGELIAYENPNGSETDLISRLEMNEHCHTLDFFFSDSTKLLSGDGRGEARIWSTAHSFCIQIDQIGRPLRSLRFSQDEKILVTDAGKVLVVDAPSRAPETAYSNRVSGPSSWGWHGYGMSLDGRWITWDGVGVIAIPKHVSAPPSFGPFDSIFGASPGVAVGDSIVSWINQFHELCAVEFDPVQEPFPVEEEEEEEGEYEDDEDEEK
ncbi:hypothetical protein LZ30DRAFT_691927 [Colletotrichum cereale]|nr:hypothetical protein LZ30DRAFT_691927 [Colletotrichum cereale]